MHPFTPHINLLQPGSSPFGFLHMYCDEHPTSNHEYLCFTALYAWQWLCLKKQGSKRSFSWIQLCLFVRCLETIWQIWISVKGVLHNHILVYFLIYTTFTELSPALSCPLPPKAGRLWYTLPCRSQIRCLIASNYEFLRIWPRHWARMMKAGDCNCSSPTFPRQ